MPIQYEGILAEHHHVRAHAGLFDICHMGEFRIEGPGAEQALEKALSHNLRTLAPGKCRYGFFLNENGGVLDDGIVYRLGPNAFMAVVNAACAAGDFAVLRERLPHNVEFPPVPEKSTCRGRILWRCWKALWARVCAIWATFLFVKPGGGMYPFW